MATDLALVETRAAALEGLEARHRRVLVLLAQGFRTSEVARLVGFSDEHVSRLKTRFRGRLDRLLQARDSAAFADSDEAQRCLLREIRNELVPAALRELLSSEHELTRARVALGLLDRTGIGPTQKVETTVQSQAEYLMSANVRLVLDAIQTGKVQVEPAGPPLDEIELEAPGAAGGAAKFGSGRDALPRG